MNQNLGGSQQGPQYGPPPGGYPPQKETNQAAHTAMKLGFGSFLCGILAPFALLKGLQARKEIAAYPGRFDNEASAYVGIGIGGFITLAVLFAVIRVASLGSPGNTATPDLAATTRTPAAAAPAMPTYTATPRPVVTVAPKPAPTPATAGALFADYQANEVSADDKYKGKALLVSGTVDGIEKDFTGAIYIKLRTSNQFMAVHAHLDSAETRAGRLSKGMQIRLACEGDGMVMGSPQLSDCMIQ